MNLSYIITENADIVYMVNWLQIYDSNHQKGRQDMKAKEGQRYYKERTRLETVIPLETPFVLLVDPSSACNIQCRFCPCGTAHSDLWSDEKKKSIGTMDFELFKKIIDDCNGFKDKIKTLRMYKEGEPLFNPHFAEMVAYAKASGKFLSIDTTTNGTLLNPKLNREIVEAGLSRINISVIGLDSQEYEDICGKKIDFDKFRANIKDLYDHRGKCHIYIKTVLERDDAESEKRKEKFYELFGDICDEIGVEYIVPCWPGFDSGEKEVGEMGIYGNRVEDFTVCPRLFYLMVINSDGAVALCHVDWSRKTVMGNVHNNTVPQLWKMLDPYRIEHLKGNRYKMPVCDVCNEVALVAVDNIDDYREELLKKFV